MDKLLSDKPNFNLTLNKKLTVEKQNQLLEDPNPKTQLTKPEITFSSTLGNNVTLDNIDEMLKWYTESIAQFKKIGCFATLGHSTSLCIHITDQQLFAPLVDHCPIMVSN